MAAHDPDTLRRALFTAYHAEDASLLDLAAIFHDLHLALASQFTAVYTLVVMFVSERGVRADPDFWRGPWERTPAVRGETLSLAVAIAKALATSDDNELAVAIDAAEAHGLIPHAARMRIVLAQRTGDHAPLERARPVLERLGDRQFLGRLDEVQRSLKGSAQAE
jgi:hypothetical protein